MNTTLEHGAPSGHPMPAHSPTPVCTPWRMPTEVLEPVVGPPVVGPPVVASPVVASPVVASQAFAPMDPQAFAPMATQLYEPLPAAPVASTPQLAPSMALPQALAHARASYRPGPPARRARSHTRPPLAVACMLMAACALLLASGSMAVRALLDIVA